MRLMAGRFDIVWFFQAAVRVLRISILFVMLLVKLKKNIQLKPVFLPDLLKRAILSG